MATHENPRTHKTLPGWHLAVFVDQRRHLTLTTGLVLHAKRFEEFLGVRQVCGVSTLGHYLEHALADEKEPHVDSPAVTIDKRSRTSGVRQ